MAAALVEPAIPAPITTTSNSCMSMCGTILPSLR
jgi:hypothetical protein